MIVVEAFDHVLIGATVLIALASSRAVPGHGIKDKSRSWTSNHSRISERQSVI